MMYPLTTGRELKRAYTVPVAAIIGNMRAPNGDVPSLLAHDDVDGLFHEFGHVLHHSLSRAPYASLSGTNVEWDFVESPSQALEEWIWQPQVIEAISGHYKTGEKMPADMVQKIIAARDMDTGITYSRQLMIASEDMTFHTANGPVDVTNVSNTMYTDILGMQPIEGGHEPATIGHFMGGYDAGYYSYLWSKVYALNIFDKFERDGLTNATTGAEYRRWILAQGNMQDGTVLLKGFLGKDPSVEVFYERLHIGATSGKK
jgi:thimet oligopeptidase